MKTAIGNENAELIRYAVIQLKKYYRTEIYSYRGYREVQEERIKTAIWFFD